MPDPSSIKTLKRFTKKSATTINPQAFFASLEKESDRGVIVVATTLLEDALTSALRKPFQQFSEQEFDALTSHLNLKFGSLFFGRSV